MPHNQKYSTQYRSVNRKEYLLELSKATGIISEKFSAGTADKLLGLMSEINLYKIKSKNHKNPSSALSSAKAAENIIKELHESDQQIDYLLSHIISCQDTELNNTESYQDKIKNIVCFLETEWQK